MIESTQAAINFFKGTYLPVFSDAASRVQQELLKPEPSFSLIAKEIGSDGELSAAFIAIALQLLKGNTSLSERSNLQDIVVALGVDPIYDVFLAAFIERSIVKTKLDHAIMNNCRKSAMACFSLAQDIPTLSRNEAYLCGLIHGLSFIFLNKINPAFNEKMYKKFLTSPYEFQQDMLDNFHFSLGHSDMVLANHWKLKRMLVKTFSLVFTASFNGVKIKKAHIRKVYSMSRLVMLAHIYVLESFGDKYVSQKLKDDRVLIEKELSIKSTTSKITTASLDKLAKNLTN